MIKYATKLALVLLICILPASASALTEKQSIELKILKAKVAEHPDNVEYLKNVGRFYQNKLHDYETALKYYDQAIAMDPNYAIPYNNKALILDTYRKYDEAIDNFNKAIENDPQYANAYRNRGNAYMDMRQYEDAVDSLKRAIELNDRDYAYHSSLGRAYDKLGQKRKAIESYNDALHLNPKHVRTLTYRANVYAKSTTDYDKAEADYERAIELKYYDAYALMNYGYFLYDKRDEQDEALEMLSNAIKYKPKYAPPYEHRAYLYRTYYNDCEKAIPDLDKAISLDSKRKNAYYSRYECYNKMSKLDEAHADLKKYIELVPDSQKAISNLEELEGKIK